MAMTRPARFSVRVLTGDGRDIVDRTDDVARAYRIFVNAVRRHKDHRIEVRTHTQADTIGTVICSGIMHENA